MDKYRNKDFYPKIPLSLSFLLTLPFNFIAPTKHHLEPKAGMCRLQALLSHNGGEGVWLHRRFPTACAGLPCRERD